MQLCSMLLAFPSMVLNRQVPSSQILHYNYSNLAITCLLDSNGFQLQFSFFRFNPATKYSYRDPLLTIICLFITANVIFTHLLGCVKLSGLCNLARVYGGVYGCCFHSKLQQINNVLLICLERTLAIGFLLELSSFSLQAAANLIHSRFCLRTLLHFSTPFSLNSLTLIKKQTNMLVLLVLLHLNELINLLICLLPPWERGEWWLLFCSSQRN